ncbi:glycosyltransferase family 4 protein [Chamaesiphon sp. OTE_8_metabat_110]|uniref:glycosyltransferase family 4 protein n=1 Tax=Chamaesiphon sp. OTE_8_metabat_110 TaxID=2964696 RepID=UPI00286A622C|nr:glycosyltransferase family 4 protein [Chamaesiphon sp. OTE_8_metabat_110]
MTRIKVALVHFCFEDYTIELANSLYELVDLTLIQPQKVAAYCRSSLDPRIRVIEFEKPRIRDPRNFAAMSALMRILRELQPDVLHVQETNDPWYDLTLFFNRMPPLVTTIHDVFRHPGDRQNIFGADYTKRIAFHRSDRAIVHAQALKQTLTQHFRVPLERVCVLPHGELGSLYRRRSTAATVEREPQTLLFFGRIWPYKGLKYLIAALPLIAAKFPAVKLIIAGKGENFEQYFPDGVDRHQIEIIDDFIPPERVAALFERSTIAVLPYIESSQSGVATLAYGMGTLVVASAIGGLTELIESGQDGLLVPPGNVEALAAAIIRLLSDRQLQQQLQAAAFKRCQQDLNWTNIATQTVEIYHQAIADKYG